MWRWVRGQRERAAQGREEQRKTPVKHLRVHLYTYYMLLHIVHVYDITRRGGGRSVGGLKQWETVVLRGEQSPGSAEQLFPAGRRRTAARRPKTAAPGREVSASRGRLLCGPTRVRGAAGSAGRPAHAAASQRSQQLRAAQKGSFPLLSPTKCLFPLSGGGKKERERRGREGKSFNTAKFCSRRLPGWGLPAPLWGGRWREGECELFELPAKVNR